MATKTFIGGAGTQAQVTTITPGGSITTGDVNHIKPLGEDGSTILVDIPFTTTGTTTAAAISAGLIAAWNANPIAAAIATASGSSTVVLTAVTAGVPFYASCSVVGVGTLTPVTGTANKGPSDYNTAANWSDGAVPSNSDTLYVNENMLAPLLYGLNVAQTGLVWHCTLGKAFNIGSAAYGLNPGSGATVYEGEPPTSGTGAVGAARTKYMCGTNVVTFYVYGTSTSTSADSGRANVQISGGGSGTAVYVVGTGTTSNAPRLDIGMVAGQSGTITTLAQSASGATVNAGPGMTIVTATVSAGTITLNSAPTTLTTSPGAIATVNGSGTTTTSNVGGTTYHNNRTTPATTLSIFNGGTVDFSNNPAAGTVATTNLYAGGTILTNAAVPGHITFTTLNKFDGGRLALT